MVDSGREVRVAVLGAGALGSLYGAVFADAGCDVTLLARPTHAQAVTEEGLRVTRNGEVTTRGLRAVAQPEELAGPWDGVMVAAKAHDVPALVASVQIEPRWVFSVQNGLGKDAPLIDRFGRGTLVGCVSMVGGTLAKPGHVVHTFPGTTYLGDHPGGPPGGAAEIAGLLAHGGLSAEIRPDIEAVNWSKVVLAVAAMGVVGITRLAYHRVFLDDQAALMFLDLIGEAASVAAAEAVSLTDLPGPLQIATLSAAGRDEGREVLRRVGRAMVAAGQTDVRVSVLQSLETGRRTEVEAVHGEVLRRAGLHGIDTPVLRTVTRALRAADAASQGGGI
jgi:2-dehydropantoate 2-reductase